MSLRPMFAKLPARWSPDDARGVLHALDASGLSVTDFARREGIDPQRLYMWRRKLGSRPAHSAGAVGARLVELRVRQSAPVGAVGIEVACPSGHVVRVLDSSAVEMLAAVLRAVECGAC